MSVLEQLRKELEQNNNSENIDFSKGVMNIADFQPLMERQYKEG